MPEALDFNPHFRKGSDKKNEQRDVKQGNFNPHFRKGSDLEPHHSCQQFPNFNPHFRKGSDLVHFKAKK